MPRRSKDIRQKRKFAGFGWLFVLIAGFFFLLLVVLLPLTTAVPAWIWVPLLLAFLALLFFRKRVGNESSFTLMLLIAMVSIGASQSMAATPPIRDDQGAPIPGSISTLEQVELNGSQQWITIRGRDATKPVLLNLGMGGPGGGGFATRSLFEPLEEHFVVVSWDEPGTGKSYTAVPIAALTKERFVEDAHALSLYLRERFHQDKIYVYGVSWTSILGVWLVQQYPDLYHAYIGNGQMVNTVENDVMGYELALKHSEDQGDSKTVEKLRENGPPPYFGAGMLAKYVAYLDILNDIMGSPRYTLIVPIIPFLAPEYGYIDKINHTRGLIDSFQAVYPQLVDLDFKTQAPKFEVPVYIFAGRDDVNAMSSLVEEYFDVLQAPRKELIWLNGGHGLGSDNLDQFVDVMVNQVLAETQTAP